MSIRVKYVMTVIVILLTANVYGYTVKGLNFVENKYGTKVTVYHNMNKPVQYSIIGNDDSLFAIELKDIASVEVESPAIKSKEIRNFDLTKIDANTIRLAFIKDSCSKVTVDNTDKYLTLTFHSGVENKINVQDLEVNDNLMIMNLQADSPLNCYVEKNGNIAKFVIKNAVKGKSFNELTDLTSDYFQHIDIKEKSGDLVLTVSTKFDSVDAKVRNTNGNLTLYVGERLSKAEDVGGADAETKQPTPHYAFVTKTIEGGNKKYIGDLISIDLKDVDIKDLLRYISDYAGLNLIADESVTGTATYRFTKVPWDQVLEIILKDKSLGSELENGVLRVATMEKFRKEEEQRRRLKAEKEQAVELQTITKALSYAKVKGIEKIIKSNLSSRGKLMIDERTNTMIITDLPDRMPAIVELIETLDQATAQVVIEARIVETKKSYAKEFGIQWGFSGIYDSQYGTQTGLSFPNSITIQGETEGGYAVNLPAVNQNGAIGLHLGNVLGSFSLDMVLSAMESNGGGRILNRPRVTTQNNKTAHIESGQKIPIQTVQNNTVTVKYINASLMLDVTPQITAEGTIILDVEVKKEEPDWTRTVDGNPTIITRNASTQVLVKDGGTTVIGGILHSDDQYTHDGIPGLSNIPGLRWLFSHKQDVTQNDELLIFITPKIVKN